MTMHASKRSKPESILAGADIHIKHVGMTPQDDTNTVVKIVIGLWFHAPQIL